MINIQNPKIVQRSTFQSIDRKAAGMSNFCRALEPSYEKELKLSLDLSEEQSASRIKSGGLSSTKSRGLSLSSKKYYACKKQLEHQNIMFNPENGQDIALARRKTASTLVKTSHTIHHLGRSLSKSKQDVNKSITILKGQSISEQNFLANLNLMSCSLRNQQTPPPQRESSFSLNQNRHYTVKITPSKQHVIIDQSQGYSQQSKDSKLSKIHQLRKKQFLRSSKKENHVQNIHHPLTKNLNTLNPPPNLKTSTKNLEVKTKRQFLESYIEKPMINSIILSGRMENLTDEPESPVLRLKKRLELNSINCIFEKQTLVSNQIQDNKSSTIEVQQSLIVHRNVSQNIKPLMHKMNLFSEGDEKPYKLYLGQQIYANLVVTVKELPLEQFQKFARQLRIYQEIESNRMETKNILELIKHSTDSDKHLLLKQPFTETLHDYLENYVSRKAIRLEFEYVIEAILRIVRRTIDGMEEKGMVLKRRLSLSDFVFVFMNLKFENMEMFEMGEKQRVSKEGVLEGFRQEMENYFNRISCGSLDF